MKLTKSDREAFVSAVMHDTPQIDFVGQAKKLALDAAVKKLPKKVRECWDDNTLRGFVKCDNYVSLAGC